MPKLTEDQRERQRDEIIEAAEVLVAQGGWEACTSRKIGGAMGTSHAPVHEQFKGDSLKAELIISAYVPILRWLVQSDPLGSLAAKTLRVMAKSLQKEDMAARLVVQVIALYSSSFHQNKILAEEFENTRKNVKERIEEILGQDFGIVDQGQREDLSRSIINWYEAACSLRVTNPSVTVSDLVDLGLGMPALRCLA